MNIVERTTILEYRYDHISFEYCVFGNFLTDLSQYYCYDTVCT